MESESYFCVQTLQAIDMYVAVNGESCTISCWTELTRATAWLAETVSRASMTRRCRMALLRLASLPPFSSRPLPLLIANDATWYRKIIHAHIHVASAELRCSAGWLSILLAFNNYCQMLVIEKSRLDNWNEREMNCFWKIYHTYWSVSISRCSLTWYRVHVAL